MKEGVVTDPKRIVSTLPSINYLLDQGAKSVCLMSHMGRPKGSKQMQFSLSQIVPAIEDHL
jgi:3-phosphoglycerate kinase